MYKCEKCGRLIQDFEIGEKRSYVGEFWGRDVYENLSCCPDCGCDDIFEVFECIQCGEWFCKEELKSGFCDNCLHQATPKDCFLISKEFEEKKIVKLNSFIVEMFTAEEMEDILLEALEKCGADTSKYVDGDTEWFAENLKKLKEVIK